MDVITINQPFGKMKYIEKRAVTNIMGLSVDPPRGGIYMVIDSDGNLKTQNQLRNNIVDETKLKRKYDIFFVSKSKIKESGCIENIGKDKLNVAFDVVFCWVKGGERQFLDNFYQREKYAESDIYNNIKEIVLSSIKTILVKEFKNGIDHEFLQVDEIAKQCKNCINQYLNINEKGMEICELLLEINEGEDYSELIEQTLNAKNQFIGTYKEVININREVLKESKKFIKGVK